LVLLAGVSLASGCSTKSKGGSGSDTWWGGAASCGESSGRFTPCAGDSECDTDHGFSCVDGECSYACTSHADCVAVGHCDTRKVDGERKSFCVVDKKAPKPGGLYTSCPKGTECNDAALCLGAGPGDLDAYCSIDCAKDDDCAAGYYCGTLTRPPCEDNCNVKAQPDDPRCVPSAQIGPDAAFHCGDSGVQRSVCRQREFCSPCDSDADCLAVPNQVCARDQSGEKICTRLCDTNTRSCPWGNAAQCGNYDDDIGAPTCAHRFGSCHGTGKTCEPCRTSDDCPGGACTSSQFTGERWCINLSTKCHCKTVDSTGTCDDGGCPDAPSGLAIQCIGSPTSPLNDICYAANSGTDTLLGTSPQTGCWAAN
jgi:hypothetical protein